jgi:hypothetical protein
MSMTSPHICLARTWCGYSAAVSPACWQCGDYTTSTPPFALPGRRGLSSPGSQPDRSAGTLAAQQTRSDLNSKPVTDGLGFVPYANGVHYDSEEQRRPLLHTLISKWLLPAAYATDDGAGVLYRGTDFVEAVVENDTAGAYFIETVDGTVIETPLDIRRL